MKRIFLATLVFTFGIQINAAYLVNQDFASVTPVVVADTGTEINGLIYKGYQGTGTAHTGNGKGDGNVVTEVLNDNGDITIRTQVTTTENSTLAWDADGLPTLPVSYIEIVLPTDSDLASVSYKTRQSNLQAFWQTYLRYTTDGGSTWSELRAPSQIENKSTDQLIAWSGAESGVDAIRIYQWANASGNPEHIFIDDIVITPSASTLLHHWKFENNLADEACVTNSTFNSGSGDYATGQNGSSISLGGEDYVKTDFISLGSGNPSYTVSGWFNVADNATRAILSYNNGYTQYMKLLVMDSGELRLWFQNGTGGKTINTSGLGLTAGTWYHFAVTKQDLAINIYLDGKNVKNETLDFTPNWAAVQPLHMGANESGGQLFKGLLDDIKVYNYAMTTQEITDEFDTTPAIGLEVAQTGIELSWTVEEEIGIKEFQVVNAATEEVLETIVATGEGSYSTTLAKGVEAKLVVVDNSGYTQTFVPADGNKVKAVYDLSEGWNLIAMIGDNADISALKGVTEGDIWTWDGTAYEKVAAPKACQGLWVYASKPVQAVVTADKSDADISLQSGWSLVGPTENMEIPEEAHTVYGWNDIYQNIAAEDGILIQGIGYWIFSL